MHPAATTVVDLPQLLTLQSRGDGRFRAAGLHLPGVPGIFGGQLIAQCLQAAARTVTGAAVARSIHVSFIASGRSALPLDLVVDALTDTDDYAYRSVTGTQPVAATEGAPQERTVVTALVAFARTPQDDRQDVELPAVPSPQESPTLQEAIAEHPYGRPLLAWIDALRLPLEVRPIGTPATVSGQSGPQPRTHRMWVRTPPAADPGECAAALAYASDFCFAHVVPAAVGAIATDPAHQMTSLDHAVWFSGSVLRDPPGDRWWLLEHAGRWSGGGRGLASGRIVTADGRWAATVTQECLFRPRRPLPAR